MVKGGGAPLGNPLTEHSTRYTMMAARAHASLQRVRPKVYSIAHRCTLPTVGRFGMGTAGNNKSREKQQQIEKVACDSSDGRARAFRALQRQTRDIHVTPRNENTLILSGLGVAASAMAARYGLQAYNNWKVKHVSLNLLLRCTYCW